MKRLILSVILVLAFLMGNSQSEFFNKMNQFQQRAQETEEIPHKDEMADGQYYYDSVLANIQAELVANKEKLSLKIKTNWPC